MTSESSRRLAAIDIGTNSVLLLVAEATRGRIEVLVERAEITRLGEGVDRTGRLSEAACERTLAVLRAYAAECRSLGVERLHAVGTSAMRDAAEGREFVDAAEGILGARPEVISGRREAELTFEGALSGLSLEGPVQVFDIGGGSTEIILGTAARAGTAAESIESAVSLDIGSVRLFERCIRTEPASSEDLARVRQEIRRALAMAPAPAFGGTLVGVAGTVTTLLALELGLVEYDARRVHGGVMSHDALSSLASRLEKLNLEQRRAIPGLAPGRADVIVAGAAIAVEVMAWSRAREMIVSDRGVRWGILQRMARGQAV
ncbi:MAG TPA: Ppx/GppA phosphatase family protein [Polyangiaceae bacterium]|nr:Ppx/GppA phosphatase family protein [Polyangiaceae bacterium]